MKIHNRHRPVVAETTLDMIGVRRFNGEGGDGGSSGGSGGSGTGSGGQGGTSGATGGQGDGGSGNGATGDRGGAGGGNGTASGGQGNSGNAGSGSGGSGSQNGNDKGSTSGNSGGGKRKLEELSSDELIALVREHRGEAAENRTKRNEAESQMTDLQRKVAAAFGIDVDGNGKPDPDKLATDLAAAQQTARQRSVELSVYRLAGGKDVDPHTLLDSRSFLDSVAEVDPNAQDADTRIGDKIATWAQNNPRHAAGGGNTGGRPGGGIGQGGRGQQSGPTGVAAGRALHQARKAPQQNANSTT